MSFLAVVRGRDVLDVHPGDRSMRTSCPAMTYTGSVRKAGRGLAPCPLWHGYPTPTQVWTPRWPASQEQVTPQGSDQ